MKHVFVVSSTVKDADGVLGLIYAMSHHAVAPEEMSVTYIQPQRKEEIDLYSFHDCYLRFRDVIPEGAGYKVTHSSMTMLEAENISASWAAGVATTIQEHRDSVCVFLDLGTVCNNKETTALYHVLRAMGMEDRCILYAPYPDDDFCAQWKKDNHCDDFVVRREDVTRARAIYVPMRTRFCKALGISD